jgi:hypothetical protein
MSIVHRLIEGKSFKRFVRAILVFYEVLMEGHFWHVRRLQSKSTREPFDREPSGLLSLRQICPSRRLQFAKPGRDVRNCEVLFVFLIKKNKEVELTGQAGAVERNGIERWLDRYRREGERGEKESAKFL